MDISLFQNLIADLFLFPAPDTLRTMSGLEFIRDLAVVLVIAGGVGWLCQRAGLSLVVGYLLAGAVIGPYTPPFQLVTDLDRVQMLSQVGLVFLIFSIGMDLSLQRLQRLGLSVVLATVVGAILVFHGCRLVGLALGWGHTESLFFAGMLMVSSSAIIGKVLQELNATHQRSGQLALGITVLEDGVAVVMLTLLSTLVQFGGEQSVSLPKVIGSLAAFVIFLLLVSLLVVPRLLRRLTRSGGGEVRTLIVIGLLLALAWLAARAGYSPALGAFLLGMIVASTPQKLEIERAFEGLRDMFGAVFFVAMGMLVDFQLLGRAWPLILGMTAFALFWRTIATSVGLVLAGNTSRDSMRAGLALTPLGEFSFIIAGLGVAAGAVPAEFYPAAVGASLLTTLASPFLIRNAGAISGEVDDRLPLFVREWISFYHAWLDRLGRRQQRSILWKLTGRRMAQTMAQILFVSALLLLVTPVYHRLVLEWGTGEGPTVALKIGFWTLFGVVLLAPLVAIWRNIDALSMIFAEAATSDRHRRKALQPLLQGALKTVASAVLAGWLLAMLPFGLSVLWVLVVVVVILALLTALFWRRIIYWNSRVEIELLDQLRTALGPRAPGDLRGMLEERQEDWRLENEEFVIPDSAACAGRTISKLELRRRFGASIISIDRSGIIIQPTAGTVLYPRDRLLLLGTAEQIQNCTRYLGVTRADADTPEIEELTMETLKMPFNCLHAGRTLAELDWIRQFGTQVVGLKREGRQVLNPGGDEKVLAEDSLLVLGTPRQIRDLRDWLNVAPNHAAD